MSNKSNRELQSELSRLTDFQKYYMLAETVDTIEALPGNKFALRVYNGESKNSDKIVQEMSLAEFSNFMAKLEEILDNGTYINNANNFNNTSKVISMMRIINFLRMSDAYWGVKTEIDYTKLRKNIRNNGLEKELASYLKEHEFEGYILSGMLESGIIQDIAKNRKDFESMTKGIDFAELVGGNDILESQVDVSVVLDLYKRKLIGEDVIIKLCKNGLIERDNLKNVDIRGIVNAYIDANGNEDKFPRYIFESLVQDQDLYDLYKSTKSYKYLQLIPQRNIIDRYINDNISDNSSLISKDKKIGIDVLEKAAHVTSETVLEYIYGILGKEDEQIYGYEDIKPEYLVEFLTSKKLPKRLIPSGEELFEVFEQGIFTGKDMLRLAEARVIDDSTLLETYIRQEKRKEIYKSEKLFSDEIDITSEEFMQYFNTTKSLEMLENENNSKKFADQFIKVLAGLRTEERKKVETDLIDEIYNINDNNAKILGSILRIYGEGIISADTLKEKLDFEGIIEVLDKKDFIKALFNEEKSLEEQEKSIDSMLSKLCKEQVISLEELGLIYLESKRYKGADSLDNKFLDQYVNGDLGDEIFEHIDLRYIEEYISAGKLSEATVVDIFGKGIISIDILKKANIEDISEYIKNGFPEDKLKTLYKSEILTFEGLKKLHENGVILGDWQEIHKEYNKLRSIDEQMGKFIASGDIVNTSEDQTEKKTSRVSRSGQESVQIHRTTISSDIREDFFDSLGCIRYGYKDENGKPHYFTKQEVESMQKQERDSLVGQELRREILESKSLNGYEVVLIPDLDIAILEKKKEGNATYIMNLHNAFEKMKSETKRSLRDDSTVERVLHSKGWGKNVITAICKVNGLDKKQMLDKHKESIVLTVEDYELNKEIRGMNER